MIGFATALHLICFIAVAIGQGQVNIVGTWVPAKGQADPSRIVEKLKITFRKDGSFDFVGNNVVGKGTYTIAGNKLQITLTRRNGSQPKHPREKQATGDIVENGKAILLPTGEYRGGKQVLVRLVRK